MAELSSEFFTIELTEATFEVLESWGVMAMSVLNISTVTGAVTGSLSLGGLESTDLTLAQNQSMNFGSIDGPKPLNGLIISAPAGCTIQITCEK